MADGEMPADVSEEMLDGGMRERLDASVDPDAEEAFRGGFADGPATLASYNRAYRARIDPLLGHRTLEELTEAAYVRAGPWAVWVWERLRQAGSSPLVSALSGLVPELRICGRRFDSCRGHGSTEQDPGHEDAVRIGLVVVEGAAKLEAMLEIEAASRLGERERPGFERKARDPHPPGIGDDVSKERRTQPAVSAGRRDAHRLDLAVVVAEQLDRTQPRISPSSIIVQKVTSAARRPSRSNACLLSGAAATAFISSMCSSMNAAISVRSDRRR